MSSPLDLVFAGTPAFAARHLQALLDGPHRVRAVYTQPDRSAGRGRRNRPSPVKQLAESHGLPVCQPSSLRGSEDQQELARWQPDVLVVVAYGLILPAGVLEIPRHGCLNVHASLLPRWRGAAPIERALLAGERETGVTIMQMDTGLDTGDMLYRLRTAIDETDDRITLEERLAELGGRALGHALDNLESLQSRAEPQDDSASTYAPKLAKEEAAIDWHESAELISRRIRAGIGRLPAFSLLHGERIQLLKARAEAGDSDGAPGTIVEAGPEALRIACGEGTLCLQSLQLPGRKPVAVRDALNARRQLLAPGARFERATS